MLWRRSSRSPVATASGCGCAWSVLPGGLVSLLLFALLLTRAEAAFAGRAYAAYGGVYVVAALVWLALVERQKPLLSDWLGVALCLLGAAILLLGPRYSAS